jgi:class 3 adenylate cyclase
MTLALTEPVNRTILLLDIEGFSQRDNVEQAFLRRGLHDVVEDILAGAGVERNMQYREDRGDGLIILISAEIPKTALLRALLTTAPDALRDYNRMASSSAQMRLRTVLASGEVALDPYHGTVGGLVGQDLNRACRLLDADVLREALKRRDADCVLCVSTPIYEGIVRHGHRGLRPEEFHRVDVSVKRDRLDGWLHGALPEGTSASVPASTSGPSSNDTEENAPVGTPPASAGTPKDGGMSITVNGGSLSFGGSQVSGDQIGVSGGNVTGDIIMGSVQHGSRGDRK